MASISTATMEEEEVRQGTRQLIRRFSHEIAENEPNNTLAVCLERATDSENKRLNRPWHQWYEDDDEISAYVDGKLSRTKLCW